MIVSLMLWFLCSFYICSFFFFFFKQKTAYEMRISDWSSDVCSSDLRCFRQCAAKVVDIDQARLDAVGRFGSRLQRIGKHIGRQAKGQGVGPFEDRKSVV